MYAILDALIDEGATTLKPYHGNLPADEDKRFALDALKGVDCILLRHGFVYPGHGLVQLLSDGLGETMYLGATDFDELRNQVHNIRRQRFIDARGPGPFYVVDCDVASYIYLSIAEVMKYPVYLVEIPRHNFVRWTYASGSYLDFETMDGGESDDAYYKEGWGIPDSFIGRGGILETMSEKQTLAYHEGTVAVSWSWRGDLDRMTDFYLRSIGVDKSHVFAINNLAWFYAAAPMTAKRDGAKAVIYGREGVALVPDGDELDTLACASAQNGDFAAAIATEERAIV